MNYVSEKTMGCCEAKEMRGIPCPEELPLEPLVELMHRTKEVGFAILNMAEKVESNLFGETNKREEKPASPMCHRDALEQHHDVLCDAANALSRICNMLGV